MVGFLDVKIKREKSFVFDKQKGTGKLSISKYKLTLWQLE